MSKQDYTSEHGPSWIDVEKAWDHLKDTFNGEIRVTLQRHTKKGNVRDTLVLSEFCVKDGLGEERVRVARRVWWDRREFKSLPAVLYNQALACDAWLTNMQDAAEEQATLL